MIRIKKIQFCNRVLDRVRARMRVRIKVRVRFRVRVRCRVRVRVRGRCRIRVGFVRHQNPPAGRHANDWPKIVLRSFIKRWALTRGVLLVFYDIIWIMTK